MLQLTQRFGRDSQASWPGTREHGSRLATELRSGSLTRMRRRNID